MKNLKKIVITSVTFVLFAVVFFLCSCGETPAVPDKLKMNNNGVLTWTAAENVEYEISFDDIEYVSVEKNSVDLLMVVKSAETNKIYVRAKIGKNKSEPAVYEFKVVQLAAPNRAEISVDPVTHEEQFVWNEVENANRYYFSVNGGKWISTNKASFTPTMTGNFTISVKARGYANKNVLYLESDASPVSDNLSFLLGPSLRNDKINQISWETGEDFDSYNLWIDGVKVRENVTSPLNLVTGDNPILTKTGEYDIQIEAVKGEKSAWSNIHEEFGTSNINENEIYSFDNRIFNLTTPREIAQISNERYHGDSGYSLKVFSDYYMQFNMIRYTSDVNVFNFSDVTRISYWIYIESVDDYEYDYVPAYCLPAVKFGCPNVSFFSSVDAPIGEWTKVTIDCENYYDIVFIMCFHNAWADFWPDGQPHTYTMYMDDIVCESRDETVFEDDYDYKLSYNALYAWYSYKLTPINVNDIANEGKKESEKIDYSNKTVFLEMEVCGTVTDETTSPVGFAMFSIDDIPERSLPDLVALEAAFGGYVQIDKTKISGLIWNKIMIKCGLNERGEIYLSCGRTSGEGEALPFKIYIRNVKVVDCDYVLDYTWATSGYNWYNPTRTAIDFGAEYANKTVTFSMKVCGTASATGEEVLGFIGTDGYPAIYIDRSKLSTTDTWSTITGTWTLDENGKMQTSAMCWNDSYEFYSIFIKDAAVVSVVD